MTELKTEIENKIIERYKKLVGDRIYNDFTFKKFSDKDVIKKCDNFPNCNLYLYGKTGRGKTHLAFSNFNKAFFGNMDNKALDFVFKNRFIATNSIQILRRMRQCENANEEQEVINKLSNSILIIDDLGVQKDTEFAVQTIYEIIDNRWLKGREGLIITSNLSLNELSKKFNDDRISSRIAGMCKVIKIEGNDFRL